MTAPQPLKRIVLAPGREARILAGHCWAFSNEITRIAGDAPAAGEIVEAAASSGRPLGIGFYNPNSLIAWRFLARERVEVDAKFFRDRLERADDSRKRLLPGEDSYRLCFGESDGLPGLVIDRYGKHFVLQVLCAGMEARLEAIGEALESLFEPAGVYLKNDHRARALEGLAAECRVLRGEVPPRVEISEGGSRFVVPLTEGQKTGFYFDQRENRAFLKPFWKGRRVLDLHCYIGAFSIAAAKNGALSVFGVDSSAAAVELAALNAKANGVSAEFREGDASEALAAFATGAKSERPDMILLDPPSLAPSKRHLPRALRAYGRLNGLALKVLSRGGLLATSSCSHHVSREDFLGVLRAAQAKTGRSTRLLALRGQAMDHPILLSMPETEYLHFALIEVL